MCYVVAFLICVTAVVLGTLYDIETRRMLIARRYALYGPDFWLGINERLSPKNILVATFWKKGFGKYGQTH